MRAMVNELDPAVEFYTKCPYLSFGVMTPLRFVYAVGVFTRPPISGPSRMKSFAFQV